MAVAIMMTWGLIGIIGCVAEHYEVYEVVNPFTLTYFTMIPFFPFIFHACGVF